MYAEFRVKKGSRKYSKENKIKGITCFWNRHDSMFGIYV